MKKGCTILICSLFFFTAVATNVSAQIKSFGEYDIQAGFIYKFISFVKWPEGDVPDETITIGVLGDNPFGDAFEELEGQSLENHIVMIKYFNNTVNYEMLKQCHVLYISKSESKKLKLIIKAINNKPILTISDCDNFIENGGVIGFIKKNSKVAFEINSTSAIEAKLDIRSMLKRIADRVIGQNTTNERRK
ncbi:MAG: YfiR family protein [Crocinitomicaceae bacterium]|nr:YfiR family protein [Crocinitomicaceae bacterium]